VPGHAGARRHGADLERGNASRSMRLGAARPARPRRRRAVVGQGTGRRAEGGPASDQADGSPSAAARRSDTKRSTTPRMTAAIVNPCWAHQSLNCAWSSCGSRTVTSWVSPVGMSPNIEHGQASLPRSAMSRGARARRTRTSSPRSGHGLAPTTRSLRRWATTRLPDDPAVVERDPDIVLALLRRRPRRAVADPFGLIPRARPRRRVDAARRPLGLSWKPQDATALPSAREPPVLVGCRRPTPVSSSS